MTLVNGRRCERPLRVFNYRPVAVGVNLTVYGPLRSATGSKEVEVAPDRDTVDALLVAFVDEYPRAESQLLDEDGELRPSVRVMVDGKAADSDESIPPGADVKVFPAMRGG